MFRDIPPKTESGSQGKFEFVEWSVLILKIFAYVFTFGMVLVGGVVAKACILLMTSQLNLPEQGEACLDGTDILKVQQKNYVCFLARGVTPTTAVFSPLPEEKVLWTWVLLIVVCIPEFGTFVRSARMAFFKNNTWPGFLDVLFIAFMETCQALGTAILIFEVLPNLDVIRGAMLTNGVCFIPAVLRKLLTNLYLP